MNIFINNKSGVPIYDQIYTKIKEQIISGELKENDPLPSIRGLAKDLKISFITTKRAYDELEREGFIYTVPAKGCYVSGASSEFIKEGMLREIEAHIDEILSLSKACGVSYEEISDMIKFSFSKD